MAYALSRQYLTFAKAMNQKDSVVRENQIGTTYM